MHHKDSETSWESSARWYDKAVGPKGHYYHQQVVIPGVLGLLQLKNGDALLDLACGQGVLARQIPKGVRYLGIDASPSLVQSARASVSKGVIEFAVHDLSLPVDLGEARFSHAVCILALQNIENALQVLQTASRYLERGGVLCLVLNHPCFRVPRQSNWGMDEQKKLQYRRMDTYMSCLKVPIQTHPSMQKDSPVTYSFHRPLSSYSSMLKTAGFTIENLEEWCSDKKSSGKLAQLENRSRREFPLFLAIQAKKQ